MIIHSKALLLHICIGKTKHPVPSLHRECYPLSDTVSRLLRFLFIHNYSYRGYLNMQMGNLYTACAQCRGLVTNGSNRSMDITPTWLRSPWPWFQFYWPGQVGIIIWQYIRTPTAIQPLSFYIDRPAVLSACWYIRPTYTSFYFHKEPAITHPLDCILHSSHCMLAWMYMWCWFACTYVRSYG